MVTVGMGHVKNISTYIFQEQLLPRKIINVAHDSNIHVSIPDVNHELDRTPYFLLLQAQRDKFLNLTISVFVLHGPPHYKCMYGGMSVYDYVINHFEEFLSLCRKYNYSNPSVTLAKRSIYSQNSTFLTTLYQYKEYGTLTVRFTVAHSECMGIKIDSCSIKQLLYPWYSVTLKSNNLYMLT